MEKTKGKGNGRRTSSRRTFLLKYVVAPLIAAVLGYLGAHATERVKVGYEINKLKYEQRIATWRAIAEYFPKYISNWKRLRTISEYEQQGNKLPPAAQARKNRYVDDRDIAKDKLLSELEKAKYFFKSSEVREIIEQYEKFEDSTQGKYSHQLPPMSEWYRYQTQILRATEKEITDE